MIGKRLKNSQFWVINVAPLKIPNPDSVEVNLRWENEMTHAQPMCWLRARASGADHQGLKFNSRKNV